MTSILISLLLFCVFVFVYFIPTIVAEGKKYSTGIFITNFFLGWTLLGWVGALVWAVCSPKDS